jgi:hypothetical protein
MIWLGGKRVFWAVRRTSSTSGFDELHALLKDADSEKVIPVPLEFAVEAVIVPDPKLVPVAELTAV